MWTMTAPEPLPPESVGALADHLGGRRVAALTGAGVSTESGIPDYRSPEAGTRPRRPIQGPDFVRSAATRRRYWARAMVGWETFCRARPGAAHRALARLENLSLVSGVITQNVDRLHQAAGSRQVIELHGALAEVICLACGAVEDRERVQARMREANRSWVSEASAIAPDGDADLADELVQRFTPPTCLACDGALKPRVVFFGENVARALVERAYEHVDGADALLVTGTSLAVFSGFRFLRRAVERRIPVVIVNRGPVRGEEHAALKIEASTGAALQALAERLAWTRENHMAALDGYSNSKTKELP